MRSLRSRCVDSKSSSSEVECNTSLTKISKKKGKRNRRSKKSITNEDTDNDITEETMEALNNTKETIKKPKKLKKNKKFISATQDSDLENPEITMDALNSTEQSINMIKNQSIIKKKVKRSIDKSENDSENTLEILNVSETVSTNEKVIKKNNLTNCHSDIENTERTLEILNISDEISSARKNKSLKKKISKKSQIYDDADIENTYRTMGKPKKSVTKKKAKTNCTDDDSENEILERTMNVLNEKSNNIVKNKSANKRKVKKSLRHLDDENPVKTIEILNISASTHNVSNQENFTVEKSKKCNDLNYNNSEITLEIIKNANTTINENQNTKSKGKKSRKSLISNQNDHNSDTVIKVSNKDESSVDGRKKGLKKSKMSELFSTLDFENDLVTSERLSNTQTFFGLTEKDDKNVTVNLDDEVFPAGSNFLKLEKSSSANSLNRSFANNIECIEIEDSIIEDSDKVRDATFEKVNETFSTKTLDGTFNKDSSQVIKGSGQWALQDISNTESETATGAKIDYLSENKVTLHPKTILPKVNVLNETFDSPGKSNRKRWVKFLETGTIESPLLKNATYSELKSRPLLSSSPLEIKSTTKVLNSTFSTPLKINKTLMLTGKKNNSMLFLEPVVSTKKSTTKPKPMPNFSAIHQKAFDKMESIQDYSERKKERAKQMMSCEKSKINDESIKEIIKKPVVKSSQDLFGGEQSANKYGNRISKTPKDAKVPFKSLLRKPINFKTPQRLKLSVKENIASNIQKTNHIEQNIFTLTQKTSDKSMIPLPKINPEKQVSAHPKMNPEKPAFSYSKIKTDKPIFSNSRINPEKSSFSLSKINPEESILSHSRINSERSVLTQAKAVPAKPVSVFSRGHYIAVANKTKIQDKLSNIQNRRDTMKGVRTNRRFDLLMQMRNEK